MESDQKIIESEKQRFFELVERLRAATEESETEKLKEALAHAVFGQ
jgi:hypothetical protein